MVRYPFKLDKGWIIEKDEFAEKMDRILLRIGLNDKESADFIEYWSKELKWDKDKYTVYLIPQEEINKAIKLEFSKEPDSILRVFFYFKPMEKGIPIEEPDIEGFNRTGFTVVEWGGFGE